jgi:hypothetical protein
MLTSGKTVDPEPYVNIIDFTPRKFSTELATTPSYVQDRWHARLYFLNPILRVGLGLVWLASGIIPLLLIPHQELYNLFQQVHITGELAVFFLYASCLWNIGLGAATIADWRLKTIGILQLITVITYTIAISIGIPNYWLHPFGPLLKNIPVFIGTLIMLVISEDR